MSAETCIVVVGPFTVVQCAEKKQGKNEKYTVDNSGEVLTRVHGYRW